MANQSAVAYSGVSGTLSSSSPYISFFSSSGTYGTIPAGGVKTNGSSEFYISVSASTPTATSLPLTLQLQDAGGNTCTLSLSIFCIAKLNSLVITPQACSAGDSVTIRASFRDGSGNTDRGGIASVTACLTNVAQGVSYQVPLPASASPSGVFISTWTVPAAADWIASLSVLDTQGNTALHPLSLSKGFSSIPYDGSADVMLYSDYAWYYCWGSDMIAPAITNAGISCFTWATYYRGNLTTAVLAQHRSETVFYYSLSYPYLTSDTSLVAVVSDFLQDGGRMILAGGYVAYSLAHASYPACGSLLSNSFGASWLSNFFWYSSGCFTNIQGIVNDPIGNGLNLFTTSHYVYQDEIRGVNGGIECFRYNPASAYGGASLLGQGTAGVRTSNTVFLAWDPADLTETNRNTCVQRALNYLGLDGHGIIQFDASTYTVAEQAGSVSVTVSRIGGHGGAASVRYATTDGSATAPQDYTAVSGTLTWADGNEESHTLSVPIVDDTLAEGQKTFTLQLSDASGATLGTRSAATITIEENESRAVPADFDGDGKADPAIHSNGSWFVWFSASQYGAGGPYALTVSPSDWAVTGDFDGDAKADPAACEPETGDWTVWLSQQNYQSGGPYAVGLAGATATAGDFDGDRKADPAAFRAISGEWFVWLSSANYARQGPFVFGSGATDIPVPADYDGDGKADPAVYAADAGTLYIWFSAGGYARGGPYPLGFPSGMPAAADFDQDGKADPMIYQSDTGLWYFLLSGSQYGSLCTRF